jgi:hypothetical protein
MVVQRRKKQTSTFNSPVLMSKLILPHRFNTPQMSVGVVYQIEVLDASGKTVKRYPAKRNLVLDQGLNNMATQDLHALTQNAAAGTGTDPVKRDSGSTTFTRSGTTLTASGNFFVVGDVGRLFKFDTGEEMYITAFTDAQNVTVNLSGAIAAAEGTVWYVNQVGLQTETKRTSSLLSGSGNNQQTYVAGVWSIKRTFIFAAEVAPVTYNEIGWSHLASAGNNLFGRDIVSPGVSLIATQQLKVTCTLNIAYGPVVSTPFTNPFTGGWGDDGDFGYEGIPTNDTGNPARTLQLAFRPADNGSASGFQMSTISDAIANGSQTNSDGWIDRSGTGMVAATGHTVPAYVTGSFTKHRDFQFNVSSINRANNRCFGNGNNPGGGQWRGQIRWLMDTDQVKLNTHVLNIRITTTWQRTLAN